MSISYFEQDKLIYEIEYTLLKHNYNFDDKYNSLSCYELYDLYYFLVLKERDENLYMRWVQEGASTTMSFDDYKKEIIPSKKDNKKIEEELEDVNNMLKDFNISLDIIETDKKED